MFLNVVSFNIRCCDDPDGNSVAERAPRLNKIISEISPDIIGLQEYTPLWEPSIVKDYGGKYGIYNIYRSKSELESSPILWHRDKFEFVKADYFWLSDTPYKESRGWDELYNCYRMCVCVKLKERSEGGVINVINTHFGFGDNGQVKSVNLIKDFCEGFHDEPIIILGDFNMEPESKGYCRMTEFFTDLNAVTKMDFSETYHGYHPGGDKGEHIDYCFINNRVNPVSYCVIDKSVGGKYPSDHFGLMLNLNY